MPQNQTISWIVVRRVPATLVVTHLPRIGHRSRSASARVISMTAATPSVICDELPPVLDPGSHCGKAERTLARSSAVVPRRIPSSLLTTVRVRVPVAGSLTYALMGTISVSK
jgi:hypothetical protein